MFFASFISAALMVLSTVEAIPQGPDNGVAARGTISCPAGYYPKNNQCAICEPGYSCDGKGGRAPCAAGHYAPNNGTTGECPSCPPGSYSNTGGASSCITCLPGTITRGNAATNCDPVSGGGFQSQYGKNYACLTCCGYAAVGNGNTNATRCTGNMPYANPGSGSGCISNNPGCTIPATCTMFANGTCPYGSPRNY